MAGKFIYAGDEKLYVRGVTYGTFRPGPDGREQHDPSQVAPDFAEMREAGINAARLAGDGRGPAGLRHAGRCARGDRRD